MLYRKVVACWDQDEEKLKREDCRTKYNHEFLVKEGLILHEKIEYALYNILLEEIHKEQEDDHWGIRERVISLVGFDLKLFVHLQHVHTNQSQHNLYDV